MFFLSLATFGKNFDLFEFKLKEIFKKMKIIPREGANILARTVNLFNFPFHFEKFILSLY